MTRPLHARRPLRALSAYVVAAALTACAALGAVALTPAGAVAEDVPSIPSFDATKHLPADLITFTHVDLKALRGAPAWVAFVEKFKAVPTFEGLLKEAKATFDLDPLSDVDTFSATFRDGEGDHLLFAVNLNKFKEEALIKAINSGGGGQFAPVAGKHHRYATDREALAVVGSWVVFSTPTELAAALDAPSTDPTWAAEVKAATAKGQGVFMFKSPPGESADKAMGLKTFQVTLAASDTLNIGLSGVFVDDASAEGALGFITTSVKEITEGGLVPPHVADTLKELSGKVKRDGSKLQADLSLTPAHMDALLEIMTKF